jgi:hypothetical protein
MFRDQQSVARVEISFPHARGDVPSQQKRKTGKASFSPRTWGCSVRSLVFRQMDCVFPTHVGMFRKKTMSDFDDLGFPHARGDVPRPCRAGKRRLPFSPRTWGCSVLCTRGDHGFMVFPTHVGMFRRDWSHIQLDGSFPHARGDVPATNGRWLGLKPFSPRTWGCSES